VQATAIDKGYEILDEDISKCTGWAGAQIGTTGTPEFVMTVSAEAEPVIVAEGKIGQRSRCVIAYIANDKVIRVEESASH
jgi:hypothetical protein